MLFMHTQMVIQKQMDQVDRDDDDAMDEEESEDESDDIL